jgi:hypothetical protein
MKIDPLTTALKQVTETHQILESLITSSESFDYPRAKGALRKLTLKMRELSRLREEFAALLAARTPNIQVVQFRPDEDNPSARGRT